MKKNRRILPGLLALCLIWGLLAAVAWCKPPTEISDSERRKLAQLPAFSLGAVESGSFMRGFESYAQDQFPGREGFRSLRANVCKTLFRQKDIHGVYLAKGSAVKQTYPLSEASVVAAAKKLQHLNGAFLEGTNCKVYTAVIPEKGYFVAESTGHLGLDYPRLQALYQQGTSFAQTIDLFPDLTIENYYQTDPHWRQETLSQVANTLAEAMGSVPTQGLETVVARGDFLGLYPSQTGLSMAAEKLICLTSPQLEQCVVTNEETGQVGGIYDWEKLWGRDPYDVFLSGASAVMTIENPAAKGEKELVLFRDSFGSSLAPLLVGGYRKITLVDLRYVAPSQLPQWITFTDQDVLFLYSASLLNESAVLKDDLP